MAGLQSLVSAAARSKDPLKRAKAAGEALAEIQAAAEELRQVRIAAVLELRDAGWSAPQIGEELGLSKARVLQLIDNRKPKPRPGRIEATVTLEAARMRGAGASNAAVVKELIPVVRGFQGGDKVTPEAMAAMLGVSEEFLAPRLAKFDAAR